jgi:uncharacterized protein YndB with AHSA1/START domain
MITEETFGDEPRTQAVFRTRFLRAPRDLVFDALVNPELLARWCGPRDFKQSVCEVDLWSGGTHRQVLRGPDGRELTLSGTYREVTRPEKLVYTERFEVNPHSSHDHVVDIWLAERRGATTLTLTERVQAGRDLKAKMQIGTWEANLRSLDRLAELVDSMRAAGPADRSAREWALLPVERDGVHRPSGTYERAGLGTPEPANEVQTPDRAAGRRRALERFAALFRARP